MRLIDADAVIDICNSSFWPDTVKMRINELPTIDAVPVVHGGYIGTEYDGFADGNPVYYEWICSACGCVFEDEEPAYNYCPNCGAKMDEAALGGKSYE